MSFVLRCVVVVVVVVLVLVVETGFGRMGLLWL